MVGVDVEAIHIFIAAEEPGVEAEAGIDTSFVIIRVGFTIVIERIPIPTEVGDDAPGITIGDRVVEFFSIAIVSNGAFFITDEEVACMFVGVAEVGDLGLAECGEAGGGAGHGAGVGECGEEECDEECDDADDDEEFDEGEGASYR